MSLWVWIVLVWAASSPIAAVLLLPLMRANRAQRRASIYLSWRGGRRCLLPAMTGRSRPERRAGAREVRAGDCVLAADDVARQVGAEDPGGR